jgi:GNAT superfamily N-acetyltransferase
VDGDDVELVAALFREYAESIGVDLSFQGFEAEVAELPRGYDVLLIARVDEDVVGCVGVRPLEGDACEMKRLYVRPSGRGLGVGRALALAAIERARAAGYARMPSTRCRRCTPHRISTAPSASRRSSRTGTTRSPVAGFLSFGLASKRLRSA